MKKVFSLKKFSLLGRIRRDSFPIIDVVGALAMNAVKTVTMNAKQEKVLNQYLSY